LTEPTGVHGLSQEQTRSFWESNAATDYQGSVVSELLVSLTRRLLRGRVLDAGAGDGSLVQQIRRARPDVDVVGIDLAPKSPSVRAADLTDLPFEDASFDATYCCEVIEHAPADVAASMLREVARTLRPGGALVLTTPFAEVLGDNVVTCPGCELRFHRWGHQATFREDDFRRIAAAHGLDPLVIAPFRLNRLRRFHRLGLGFLRTPLGRLAVRGRSGSSNRTLLMIARKRASKREPGS
jgi:SAM-dependent methyltransferase